ncbi:MAG: hypothetical protein IKO74_05275 [Selenomonadaceae bacterium]|nr:hypothetical protein [Selenomonadaceae bacterium]
MLPLTVMEKVVDGVADCAKIFIGGRNDVKLENAKMQHDALIGGIILGGIALVGVIANNLMDKCDEISVGANKKDGVHFRAKKC